MARDETGRRRRWLAAVQVRPARSTAALKAGCRSGEPDVLGLYLGVLGRGPRAPRGPDSRGRVHVIRD
jgi:hypothetical protein